jgi:hypothetical protein
MPVRALKKASGSTKRNNNCDRSLHCRADGRIGVATGSREGRKGCGRGVRFECDAAQRPVLSECKAVGEVAMLSKMVSGVGERMLQPVQGSLCAMEVHRGVVQEW